MKNHTLKPLAFAALACAALAASAAVLPTGYTELGYIQGNGSDSRIVTDYTPDPSTDKIEAVVEFPTLDKPMAIWCARGATANTNTWSMLAMGSGDRLRFDYGAYCDCNKFFTSAPAVNTTYTITADRNMATLNGAGSVGYDFEDSFTEAGGPLVLFAAYAGGTGRNKNFWADYRLFFLQGLAVGRADPRFRAVQGSRRHSGHGGRLRQSGDADGRRNVWVGSRRD